jgi:hypothetical protein
MHEERLVVAIERALAKAAPLPDELRDRIIGCCRELHQGHEHASCLSPGTFTWRVWFSRSAPLPRLGPYFAVPLETRLCLIGQLRMAAPYQ